MIRYYAQARRRRTYNIRNQWTARAIARLAYYTDIIGDAKMASTSTRRPTRPTRAHSRKLTYTNGMYVQTRSGPRRSRLPPNGTAGPLPVAP